MKIAVLSDNILGVEFANYLSSLGADVVFFTALKAEELSIAPEIKIITDKILWVQKKALSHTDLVGNERMKDLFRVVFEIKPDFTSTDPNFTKELQASLSKELDMFIDVDGVIAIEDKFATPNFTHPSHAPALGETKYQNLIGMKYEPMVAEIDLPDSGEIAIVGHSLNGAQSLKKIFQWLLDSKEKERRVFWITHQGNPWEHVYNEELLSFKEKLDIIQEAKIKKFLTKNKSWMELEDYEKVKIPKPFEPIPQLVIFAGHHTTAIDTLLNSQKIYLTLESSTLHPATIQSENAARELKTISIDHFYIFNGHSFERNWKKYLTSEEPGYLEYYIPQLSLIDIVQDFERNFLVFFKNESEGNS